MDPYALRPQEEAFAKQLIEFLNTPKEKLDVSQVPIDGWFKQLMELIPDTKPFAKDVFAYLSLWKEFELSATRQLGTPYAAIDPHFCKTSAQWGHGFRLLLSKIRPHMVHVPLHTYVPHAMKDWTVQEREEALSEFAKSVVQTIEDESFLEDFSDADLEDMAEPYPELDDTIDVKVLLTRLKTMSTAEREAFASDAAAWFRTRTASSPTSPSEEDAIEQEAERLLKAHLISAKSVRPTGAALRKSSRSRSRPKKRTGSKTSNPFSESSSTSSSSSSQFTPSMPKREAKLNLFTSFMLFLVVVLLPLLGFSKTNPDVNPWTVSDVLHITKNVAGVVLGARTMYVATPFTGPMATTAVAAGACLFSHTAYNLYGGFDNSESTLIAPPFTDTLGAQLQADAEAARQRLKHQQVLDQEDWGSYMRRILSRRSGLPDAMTTHIPFRRGDDTSLSLWNIATLQTSATEWWHLFNSSSSRPDSFTLNSRELDAMQDDVKRYESRGSTPASRLQMIKHNVLFPELSDSGLEMRDHYFATSPLVPYLSASLYGNLAQNSLLLTDLNLALLVSGVDEHTSPLVWGLASVPADSFAQTAQKNLVYAIQQFRDLQGYELGNTLGEGGSMIKTLVKHMDHMHEFSKLKGVTRSGVSTLTPKPASDANTATNLAHDRHIYNPQKFNKTLFMTQAAFGMPEPTLYEPQSMAPSRYIGWLTDYIQGSESALDLFQQTLSETDKMELAFKYEAQWTQKKKEIRQTHLLKTFEKNLKESVLSNDELDLHWTPATALLFGDCIQKKWKELFAPLVDRLKLEDTIQLTPKAVEILQFFAFRNQVFKKGAGSAAWYSTIYQLDETNKPSSVSHERGEFEGRMFAHIVSWDTLLASLEKLDGHSVFGFGELRPHLKELNKWNVQTIAPYVNQFQSNEALQTYLLSLTYLNQTRYAENWDSHHAGSFTTLALNARSLPLALGMPPLLSERVFSSMMKIAAKADRYDAKYADLFSITDVFRNLYESKYELYKEDYAQGRREAYGAILKMTEPAFVLGLQKEARLSGAMDTVFQEALTMMKGILSVSQSQPTTLSQRERISEMIIETQEASFKAESRDASITHHFLRLLTAMLAGGLISVHLAMLLSASFHGLYHKRLEGTEEEEAEIQASLKGYYLPLPLLKIIQKGLRAMPFTPYDKEHETALDKKLRKGALIATCALNILLMGEAAFYGSFSISAITSSAAYTIASAPVRSLTTLAYNTIPLLSVPLDVLASWDSFSLLSPMYLTMAGVGAVGATAQALVSKRTQNAFKEEDLDEKDDKEQKDTKDDDDIPPTQFEQVLFKSVDLTYKTGKWLLCGVLGGLLPLLFNPYLPVAMGSILEAKYYQTLQVSLMYRGGADASQPVRRIDSLDALPWDKNPWLFHVFTSAPSIPRFDTIWSRYLHLFADPSTSYLLPLWTVVISYAVKKLVVFMGGKKMETTSFWYTALDKLQAVGRSALTIGAAFSYERTWTILKTIYDSAQLHLGLFSSFMRTRFLYEAYFIVVQNSILLAKLLSYEDLLSSDEKKPALETVEQEAYKVMGVWKIVAKFVFHKGRHVFSKLYDHVPEQLKIKQIRKAFILKLRAAYVSSGTPLAPLNANKIQREEAKKVVSSWDTQDKFTTPSEAITKKKKMVNANVSNLFHSSSVAKQLDTSSVRASRSRVVNMNPKSYYDY